MRLAPALLLLTLFAMPATAVAQDGGVDPAATPDPAGAETVAPGLPALDYAGPSARISRGAPLTFAVRTEAPAGSVIVRVSSSDETDAAGLLDGDAGAWVDEAASPAGAGVLAWNAPASSILRQRPGHYYWQAYVDGEAADNAEEPVGPVRELDVTQPLAFRGHGKLYPRFGRSAGTSFYLSSTGFPASVDGKRFQTLAKKAAARWGLHALRWTSAAAGKRDGFNVAGFSSSLPDGALGLETDYMSRGRVVERDLALAADQNWDAGPDYPALDQIDLETVLLHELGHMAGNTRHRKRCANSPMIEALGEGEWWRGSRDHWYADCTSAGAARASRAGAFAHRVVRID